MYVIFFFPFSFALQLTRWWSFAITVRIISTETCCWNRRRSAISAVRWGGWIRLKSYNNCKSFSLWKQVKNLLLLYKMRHCLFKSLIIKTSCKYVREQISPTILKPHQDMKRKIFIFPKEQHNNCYIIIINFNHLPSFVRNLEVADSFHSPDKTEDILASHRIHSHRILLLAVVAVAAGHHHRYYLNRHNFLG